MPWSPRVPCHRGFRCTRSTPTGCGPGRVRASSTASRSWPPSSTPEPLSPGGPPPETLKPLDQLIKPIEHLGPTGRRPPVSGDVPNPPLAPEEHDPPAHSPPQPPPSRLV